MEVQSWSAKRILVGTTVLYAVLLQSFAVSAVPAAAFNSYGGIICLQDTGATKAPAKDPLAIMAFAVSWLVLLLASPPSRPLVC